MNDVAATAEEQRVVLLAPTSRDGTAAAKILAAAQLESVVVRSPAEVCDAVREGAGVVVLPEECLLNAETAQIIEWLRAQESWSDLPVIVLSPAGRASNERARLLHDLGDVTVLKRPLETLAFVGAIRAALRDRGRQYFVRRQLAESQRQTERLQDADRRKDEFLAMLAHELRNPLAPIQNGLEIMRLAADEAEVVAEMREVMARQVRHLSRLVDDLLDVARITRGKAQLHLQPTDLKEILAEAIEVSRPLIEARRQRLTVTQPGHPVYVAADPLRMTQVVGNLLNNAAKYGNEQGKIELCLENGAGNDAVIRVRDTGVGIPPEMLSKVFELFAQVDRSLDRSQGGLGIGLTLVRSLVEMHGGTVAADSEGPGRGSEFVVRLPAIAAPDADNAADGDGERTIERRRVLVVDDNVDAAHSLATLLRLIGHDVQTEHDGRKVQEAVAAFHPDVVLLDIGLPGLDGYAVARLLRSRPSDEPLLLIALTGYGQAEDRAASRAAGFDHHLTKPVDFAVLRQLLTSSR